MSSLQNGYFGYPDAGATAVAMVANGYDYYVNQANLWIYQTQNALNGLAYTPIVPITFGAGFNLTNVEGAFTRPTKPAEPFTPGVSTAVPDMPTLAALVAKSAGDAPADIDVSGLLAYTLPDRTLRALPESPSRDYQLVEIVIPGRPPILIPALPDMEAMGVITYNPLNFQAFQGVRPTFNIPVPDDGTLDFQEVEYSPALAGAIQSALGLMMQGGLGLPPAVEQAMFDRARGREDRLSRKQIQEVAEDMSQRGFVEPNGILPARLREVRADNREKGAALNRDLAIEVAKIGVENVRAGVAQGIAWEQVLISKAEAQSDRAFRFAVFGREYGIKRVDALVAIANLEQQAYSTDAQVFKVLIDAEVAKLAELEAQIKIEALKGQRNENLIRQYEAQWKGVQAMADFYKTDIDAAKAKGEINVQRIQAAEVDARIFASEVDAWGKEREGYRWDVEASLAPLKAAETLSSVFAQRMVGYKTKAEAVREENRIQIDGNQQAIEVARLALSRTEQIRLSESANIDAILRKFQGSVSLYQADGAIAQAESASRDRVASLAIEQSRAQADITIKGQELQMQQMLKIVELMLSKNKAMADVLSQLVAASQSAVHLGASISAGASSSTSFSYSGEI